MFVQWSDWHLYENATWDSVQKTSEEALIALMKEFSGLVTITYANNEPGNSSEKIFADWEKTVKPFAEVSAGYGLSDQAWLYDTSETECPAGDIIRWAKSALDRKCAIIQFEPVWYFFLLPRGSFGLGNYLDDPSYTERGNPTDNFLKLKEALMEKPE